MGDFCLYLQFFKSFEQISRDESDDHACGCSRDKEDREVENYLLRLRPEDGDGDLSDIVEDAAGDAYGYIGKFRKSFKKPLSRKAQNSARYAEQKGLQVAEEQRGEEHAGEADCSGVGYA